MSKTAIEEVDSKAIMLQSHRTKASCSIAILLPEELSRWASYAKRIWQVLTYTREHKVLDNNRKRSGTLRKHKAVRSVL
jgi:hypothetical protein